MNRLTTDSPVSYTHLDVYKRQMKDGQPVELSEVYGGRGQFEDQFSSPQSLFDDIERQYEHLVKKSQGVFADARLKTCVLAADLAGILAHEAIGHTTEADMVMSGSVASGKIGKEVASPLITLVDFANSFEGQTCPVPVSYTHLDVYKRQGR